MVRYLCFAVASLLLLAVPSVSSLAQDAAPSQVPQEDPASGEATFEDFSDAQIQQIRAVALAAILDYPEIIEEAAAILQERRSNEALAAILRDPITPVLGNPEGDVTLIEFFDYNCGYCRRVAEPLRALIQADPALRVLMVEAPILSEESLAASQASVAASILGADYDALHFAIMASNVRATGESVLSLAEEQGVDRDAVMETMDSIPVMASLAQNYSAMQAMEIGGTPAFIVGRGNDDGSLSDIVFFPGAVPVEELELAIARLREGS
ncbi:MAG: DsbA family protein [Rhodospirillaceae bacterium]|nr:MAG: DsbA family protein [Rhodospirillaceae bacterium]